MQIEGCTALVTGANRGIGEALVSALLQRGAHKVHAAARDPSQFAPALLADTRVVPLALDVTRPEQAEAAARSAPELNLLINNAGIAHYGVTLLDDGIVDNLRAELEVNVIGVLHMFRAFMRTLVRNRGAMANVLSGAALQHNALLGMRTLMRRHGCLVSSVIVGGVDTRLSRDIPSGATRSSPALVAANLLDGLARDEEDIDTAVSAIARMVDAKAAA